MLDLVDTLTQLLFASSLVAEGLPAAYKRSLAEGRQGLEELRRLIRSALGEVYSLQMELRPEALQSRPLVELLHQVGDALSSQANVQVVAPDAGAFTLPPQVHTALYRIAYDTLHALDVTAPGAQVLIELRYQPDAVVLQITGDGARLDPATDEEARAVLRRIAAGATAIGATVEHASRPPASLALTVRWPLLPLAALSPQDAAA